VKAVREEEVKLQGIEVGFEPGVKERVDEQRVLNQKKKK